MIPNFLVPVETLWIINRGGKDKITVTEEWHIDLDQ